MKDIFVEQLFVLVNPVSELSHNHAMIELFSQII